MCRHSSLVSFVIHLSSRHANITYDPIVDWQTREPYYWRIKLVNFLFNVVGRSKDRQKYSTAQHIPF